MLEAFLAQYYPDKLRLFDGLNQVCMQMFLSARGRFFSPMGTFSSSVSSILCDLGSHANF
jgi:hypothetical protein